ncbi:MAG: UDP-3-O-(3-hydroxymyristoyl)glucosamine N-acyltransferase [Candidatus Eremiobacterota bacterium]
MRLEDIAEKLNCSLTGNGNIEIKRVTGIKEAVEGDLTFLANKRYIPELKRTKASAVIISRDYPEIPLATLRTDNPYLTFAKAVELFYEPIPVFSGIHPGSVISPGVIIGENPSIHACAVIGDHVVIGDNVTIYPNVTVYPDVIIGNNVVIHSNSVIREHTQIGNNVIIQNGAVIGGDGFAFAKSCDGTYYKIAQIGQVIIEDNVEIQCNSAVDRATVGNTVIKKGTKIDNLVQVGHGCQIGENSILCGLVGLAGTTEVGNNVVLAGQVGVAGHVSIVDNVCVAGQSGVTNSIKEQGIFAGLPSIKASAWKKASVCFEKLPELFKRIKKIEKLLDRFDEKPE